MSTSILPELEDELLVVDCSSHKRLRELGLHPRERGEFLSSESLLFFLFEPSVRKDLVLLAAGKSLIDGCCYRLCYASSYFI